jgi:hypothetical protein
MSYRSSSLSRFHRDGRLAALSSSPSDGTSCSASMNSVHDWCCSFRHSRSGSGCGRVGRDAAERVAFGAAELVGGRAEGGDEGGQAVGAGGFAQVVLGPGR